MKRLLNRVSAEYLRLLLLMCSHCGVEVTESSTNKHTLYEDNLNALCSRFLGRHQGAAVRACRRAVRRRRHLTGHFVYIIFASSCVHGERLCRTERRERESE